MGRFVEVKIGTKLNKLTSVSKSFKKAENKTNEYWIKCKCDCGVVKDIRKRDFLQARIVSCGCGQLVAAKQFGLKSRKYSGIESAKRLAYGVVKTKAKSRSKTFTLTFSEFLKITEANGLMWSMCHLPLFSQVMPFILGN